MLGELWKVSSRWSVWGASRGAMMGTFVGHDGLFGEGGIMGGLRGKWGGLGVDWGLGGCGLGDEEIFALWFGRCAFNYWGGVLFGAEGHAGDGGAGGSGTVCGQVA